MPKWVAHKYVGLVPNGTVTWLHDFSFNVIRTRPSQKQIDFLFIDGDHSETGGRTGWNEWSPYIKPGGFVAFHDARPFVHDIPGSTKVVNFLFRGEQSLPDWEIVEEVDSIVVVRRVG